MHYQDIIQKFKEAALNHGVVLPDDIKADGDRHRFNIDGKPNGFYTLHLDGKPAGCFQNWKLHDKPILWKAAGEFKPFTAEEKRQYTLKRATEEQQRKALQAQKHHQAANRAAYIWQHAKPATTAHPYLTRKAVQPHRTRIRIYKEDLVLPLYDAAFRLVSLQFIDVEGQKRFLSGGKKHSCFWWIGKPSQKVLIAEGFATAASLFEATGYQCFIAFDAGNLTPVATLIRAQKPHIEIVLCADHDETGKGQLEAEKAALAVGGLVAMPPMVGDFNDYALQARGHNG